MAGEEVLVVEDETITALDIERSLKCHGYCVPGIACTGAEAVALARQSQPDLVRMDIRLKGEIDGIAAAEQIRKELNVPVIFLTAYAACATLERVKRAEPFAYLLKPFEEAVLATTIEIALNKHRAHELVVQQATETLPQSEKRFQHLATNVADYAILLLNAAGQILSWNPGAEQIYGWDASDILGQHCSALYPPEEVAQHKPDHDLETATRAGRVKAYGCQTRKDGSRFSAKTVLVALQSGVGEPAGFLKLTRESSPGDQHS